MNKSKIKHNIQKKINYDKLMGEIIKDFTLLEVQPKILLHSCCAPCSSSVIRKLAPYFDITVFYYNPNIDTAKEYSTRAEEQKRIIQIYNDEKISKTPIKIIDEPYLPEEFDNITKNLEDCPEGGVRCMRCYLLRLDKTAKTARLLHYDFFCTTLSVSPLKNSKKINQIGQYLSKEKTKWLPSDFKKRNGYLDSIKLSKKFGLYRQDYCGCKHSK